MGSRRFAARVFDADGNIAPGPFPGAQHVRLIDNGFLQPKDEIQYQFIATSWCFDCDASGRNCNPCGFGFGVGEWNGSESWNDNGVWEDFRMLLDQTGRDWSLGCSDAFAPSHSFGITSSFREKVPRQHLVYNDLYWLETAVSAEDTDIHQLVTGRMLYSIVQPDGSFLINDLGPLCNLGICSQPFPGTRSDTVTVVLVGRFDFFGAEVDPTDPDFGFRAITNPPTTDKIDDQGNVVPAVNSTGLVVISDYPGQGSRPEPMTETQDFSVLPLINGLSGCSEETCWWGPGKSIDTTPNLLSHELMHLFTGFVEVDAEKFPTEIQDTFLVGRDKDDGGIVRRGFKLAVPFHGNTAAEACQWAHTGAVTPGRDYVH